MRVCARFRKTHGRHPGALAAESQGDQTTLETIATEYLKSFGRAEESLPKSLTDALAELYASKITYKSSNSNMLIHFCFYFLYQDTRRWCRVTANRGFGGGYCRSGSYQAYLTSVYSIRGHVSIRRYPILNFSPESLIGSLDA